MNYAVRSAKQEITEAGKFLRWLHDEHGRTASSIRQMHLDEYLSEGTSTRRHIRNFIQYLKRETPGKDIQVAARLARTTPVLSQQERLDLVRDHVPAAPARFDGESASGWEVRPLILREGDTIHEVCGRSVGPQALLVVLPELLELLLRLIDRDELLAR